MDPGAAGSGPCRSEIRDSCGHLIPQNLLRMTSVEEQGLSRCVIRMCHRSIVGTGPILTSNPGSLSRPSSAVSHSICLNAETCLPSIWRCRLADTFPSRPPSPVGMPIAQPVEKPRLRWTGATTSGGFCRECFRIRPAFFPPKKADQYHP